MIITNVVNLQKLDSHLISLKGQNIIHKILNKQNDKGEKVMRTKDRIKQDVKASMKHLNLLVEESVKSEQNFERGCKSLESRIKALEAETPFEDTLLGQAWKFKAETKKEIQILLDELQQKTGIKWDFKLIPRYDESNT